MADDQWSGRVGSSLVGVHDRRDRDRVEPSEIARVVDLDAKRVVDVGCGTGRLTAFAARHAAFVYAFDPSSESIAQAREEVASEDRARVRFAVHDAEALDVPRERFDLALCGWSLWCVPLEGVVNALRRIHAALVPGGVVVDTQPVSTSPPVRAGTAELGRLDMRGWGEIVEAVDRRVDEAVRMGLFTAAIVAHFVVVDRFSTGTELLGAVSEWKGTRVPGALEDRLRGHDAAVQIHQEIRLRLLTALG